MATLDNFLKAHKYDKSKHPFISHTRIGCADSGIEGGSYYIPADKLDRFYELYTKKIQSGTPEYLTEKQDRVSGLLYVDFDFKYETLQRPHNENFIDDVVDCIIKCATRYITVDDTVISCYSMERQNPYHNGKHNKNGIHLLFNLNVDRRIQLKIREDFLKTFNFSKLPLINTPDDVYDEGVVKGSCNLQLAGSQKPNCSPYQIIYKADLKYDPADGEISNQRTLGSVPITPDLLKLITTYENKSLHYFPPTREGASILNVAPPPMKIICDCSPKDMENNYKFAMMAFENGLLSKQSNSSGMAWRAVGMKLKSIFGDTEDAYKLFDAFNKLSTNMYKPIDNRIIWDSFPVNPDYSSFGLLAADFKASDPMVFKQIQQEMKDAERVEYREEMERKRLDNQARKQAERLDKQAQKETERLDKQAQKEAERTRREEIKAQKQADIQAEIDRKKAEKEEKYGLPMDALEATDDNHAIDLMINMIGKNFLYIRGQLYYKDGNKWVIDDELIKHILLKQILEAHIYKFIKDKFIPYYANVSAAKSVRDGFLSKIKLSKCDDSVYDKFHTSTRNKICFQDGVLDIKEKTFTKWSRVPPNTIFTTVIIERNYFVYFHNPNHKTIATIKKDVLTPLFGDKLEDALHFFSRACGANIQDKNFMSYTGNRNCGKGIIEKLFKASLQSYVASFSLDNLLCMRDSSKSSDIAKENAWLIPLQYSRLAFSQETEDEEEGRVSKKMKISNKSMKSIMSGGDTITARGLYKDAIQFTLDSALVIMGNNSITMSGEDSNEHHLMLQSVSKFVSKEKYDQKKAEIGEAFVSSWRLRDETLVDKVLTDEYTNAFVYLLYQSFKLTPVSISNKSDDGAEYYSVREKIFKTFIVTKNDKDRVPKDELFKLIKADQKKIKAELRELGCVGDDKCRTTVKYTDENGMPQTKQVQAFKGLVLKQIQEEEA